MLNAFYNVSLIVDPKSLKLTKNCVVNRKMHIDAHILKKDIPLSDLRKTMNACFNRSDLETVLRAIALISLRMTYKGMSRGSHHFWNIIFHFQMMSRAILPSIPDSIHGTRKVIYPFSSVDISLVKALANKPQ